MRTSSPVDIIRQPVFLTLGVAASGSLIGLPVLRHAPNRLLSGQPLDLGSLGWVGGSIVTVISVSILLLGFVPKSRAIALVGLGLAWALPLAFLLAAGQAAASLAATSPESARTTFAAGGWLIIVIGLLALAQAVATARLSLPERVAVFAAVALGFGLPIVSGRLDDLALLKEYQAKSDVFSIALVQHGFIVIATLMPTLTIGLPLGLLAHRKESIREGLLSALGLIQTIPSIALFGLLMVPLTNLGDAFPLLRSLGIRGVGPAPAIIALTLYALLPVVRNTAAGLAAVSATLLEAARGQGMTDRQIFFSVELPLAAPVILAGLRITVVQTIGLTAVAALIGAGGLGSLMFQGLFADAADLILLGAVPIVIFAVVADLGFRLLTESSQRRPQ